MLFRLFKALFLTTNPVPVKTALRLSGRNVGGFRLPLCPPTDAERDEIERVLVDLGLRRSWRAPYLKWGGEILRRLLTCCDRRDDVEFVRGFAHRTGISLQTSGRIGSDGKFRSCAPAKLLTP